jgi:hypothetical protein
MVQLSDKLSDLSVITVMLVDQDRLGIAALGWPEKIEPHVDDALKPRDERVPKLVCGCLIRHHRFLFNGGQGSSFGAETVFVITYLLGQKWRFALS